MKGVVIRKIGSAVLSKRPDLLRELPFIVHQHHTTGKPKHIADDWSKRLPILRRAMEGGNYGLLVAVDSESENDTIIGFLDYHIIDCFIENTRICFLQNMRVWHPWRKKGVGTMLVRELIIRAEKAGCKEIHVVAGEGADAFYEKLGFSKKDTFLEAEVTDFFE